MKNSKIHKRLKRKLSIRKKIRGTTDKPRLTVSKSNSKIYAQIIDDTTSKTLASSSDIKKVNGTKSESAKLVGIEIAKLAIKKNIKNIKFDRNGNKYHGRVKALADGAREGGLNF